MIVYIFVIEDNFQDLPKFLSSSVDRVDSPAGHGISQQKNIPGHQVSFKPSFL